VENTRTFDLLGQLIRETGTGAETATTEKQYDHDQLGRLVTSTAPGGADTFTYNDRGAMLTSSGPSGDTTFGYDADGNLTTRTDAAGTATYGYVDNRLTSIRDGLTGTTQLLDYNDAGQLDDIEYGAGRARDFSYDDLGRLKRDELNRAWNTTRAAPEVIAAVSYEYDNDDRLTKKQTEKVADSGANTYTYDWSDRLTSWTHDSDDGTSPTTTTTYGWDGASNRTSVDGVAAEFDERNRLLDDGESTYTYTPRGTLDTKTTDAITENLTFDAFDRLAQHGPVNYTYDALDRVAARNAQQFTYTGASNELATDGASTFSRGPGGDLLALESGADKRLTLADQHGDVIAGFDPDGRLEQVADSTAYDPFGERTATTGTERPIGYQGDYTDPDTDQVNMTARWYTPGTGTFASRDNVPLPTNPSSAANRYTYGIGSPTNYADPSGHCPICVGIGVIIILDEINEGNTSGSLTGGYISPCGSRCGGGLGRDKTSSIGKGGTGGRLGRGSGGGGNGRGGSGGGRGGGGGSGAGQVDATQIARQAAANAARTNPQPIPNAVLAPVYGSSVAPPTSSAPHVPSQQASDYRDPVNDVTQSYQRLQNNIVDEDAVLGTVKSTTSAPTEVGPPGDKSDCSVWDWLCDVGDAFAEIGRQIGGFFVGLGAVVVGTVEGIFHLVEQIAECFDLFSAECIQNAETLRAIGEFLITDPIGFFGAIWDGVTQPIADAWGEGNYGEAIGLTFGALAEMALGAKGVSRARNARSSSQGDRNGGPSASNPVSMVPDGAQRRDLYPIPGRVEVGVEYKWVNEDGKTVRLRIHGPDGSAPEGSNSANGPTYRVQVGSKYMDADGVLYPPGVHNPNSSNYNPDAANATHIPWPEGVPLPWE
jgi:RHS repeat-associated protein